MKFLKLLHRQVLNSHKNGDSVFVCKLNFRIQMDNVVVRFNAFSSLAKDEVPDLFRLLLVLIDKNNDGDARELLLLNLLSITGGDIRIFYKTLKSYSYWSH